MDDLDQKATLLSAMTYIGARYGGTLAHHFACSRFTEAEQWRIKMNEC